MQIHVVVVEYEKGKNVPHTCIRLLQLGRRKPKSAAAAARDLLSLLVLTAGLPI